MITQLELFKSFIAALIRKDVTSARNCLDLGLNTENISISRNGNKDIAFIVFEDENPRNNDMKYVELTPETNDFLLEISK